MAAGLVVNPASGKDIRRLTGKASVFDNREKFAIVKRALAGAVSAGLRQLVYMDDAHGIAHTAITESNCPGIFQSCAFPRPRRRVPSTPWQPQRPSPKPIVGW
jgi:predicted polyphosphate/ATP-dependent NAD kinase